MVMSTSNSCIQGCLGDELLYPLSEFHLLIWVVGTCNGLMVTSSWLIKCLLIIECPTNDFVVM